MNPETGSTTKAAPNKSSKDEIIEFSDHPSFNFGTALSWLVTICAILITVFFWWQNRDTADAVLSKQDEKTKIIAEITSPTNIDVEKKAANFKSAVSALKAAKAEKFNNSKFLKDLSTKITTDVSIESMTLAEDGTLNLNGKTTSYRSVADLMLALKSWTSLSGVDLNSVSVQEDTNKKPYVVFAITAKLDKTVKSATKNTISSNTLSGNTSLEGGI